MFWSVIRMNLNNSSLTHWSCPLLFTRHSRVTLYNTNCSRFLLSSTLAFPQSEFDSYVIIQNFQPPTGKPPALHLCETLRIPYRIQHPVEKLNELLMLMGNLGIWKPVEMRLMFLHVRCKQWASEKFRKQKQRTGTEEKKEKERYRHIQ